MKRMVGATIGLCMLVGLALVMNAVPAVAQTAPRRSHATGVIQASATVVQAAEVSTLTPQQIARLLPERRPERGASLSATSTSMGLAIDRARHAEMSVVIEPVAVPSTEAAGSFLMCAPTDDGSGCQQQLEGVPFSLRSASDSARAPAVLLVSDPRAPATVLRATIAYIAS